MRNPLELWSEYKQALTQQLEGAYPDALRNAWQSHDAQKNFYLRHLLPRMASQMQCRVGKHNVFSVDAELHRTTEQGYQVPIVFLDVVPDAFQSDDSIGKMCSLAAPIKVLITSARWSDDLWPQQGTERDALLRMWDDHLRAHVNVWPQMGIVAVLIGEWTHELRFSALAWDQLIGDFIEDKLVFSRVESTYN